MKQIIKKLAIVLSVALVCAPMGAMAANKLIVKDATGVIDKMVVTDSGYIGIGSNAPTSAITIKNGSDPTGTALFLHNTGRVGGLATDSPGLSFFRNNDVSINGGLPRAADRLGYFGFGGLINGASKYTAIIQGYAESIWTATSAATYLSFQTASPNTTSAIERMRLAANGNLGIGTSNPTQKIEVNGGIRLNTATAIPSCISTTRGVLWFVNSAAGVADGLMVCAKDASNAYAWKPLF